MPQFPARGPGQGCVCAFLRKAIIAERGFCRMAKAIVGLRPSFSAHVRWGEHGAPSPNFLRVYTISDADLTGLFKLKPCPLYHRSVISFKARRKRSTSSAVL